MKKLNLDAMSEMHQLLIKQLSRCKTCDENIDYEKFLKMVSDVYHDSDRERRLMENAMSSMTKEVMEANQELVSQRDEILKSEERYKIASMATNDGLWEIDFLNDTFYASPRFMHMIEQSDYECMNSYKKWISIIHPNYRKEFREAINQIKSGAREKIDLEYKIKKSDGKYIWASCRGIVSFSKKGIPITITGAQSDITELKINEKKLRDIAFNDPLTGLPNRLLFMDRLEQLISRCKRTKSSMGALIFIDLNRFKFVNDTMGHDIGDMLLIKVAKILSSLIRPVDTVSRLAGDEFTILISDVTSAKEAIKITERIMGKLHGLYSFKGCKVEISSSMGVAIIDHNSESSEVVLRNADLAMYDAKEQKNSKKIKFFGSKHHKKILRNLELESEIKTAIREKHFYPVFQPIVSIQDGSLKGFEALARWRRPEKGIVMPSEFIPIAEKSGTVLDIGTYILEKSIEQIGAWLNISDNNKPLTVSVNLSVAQIVDDAHFSSLIKIVNDQKNLAKFIEFEITETLMIKDSFLAAKRIKSLKDLGSMVSIDDFGTGYSSLSYLHKYPIDNLKIDASFVQKITTDKKSLRLVSTMIAMAKDMGCKTIAEGVETVEQLKILFDIGCDYAQGYYFSKPVEAEVSNKIVAITPAYRDKVAI